MLEFLHAGKNSKLLVAETNSERRLRITRMLLEHATKIHPIRALLFCSCSKKFRCLRLLYGNVHAIKILG